MSMSTHIVGFKSPDEKWHKMKAVWDACEKAGVDTPDDVLEYFEHEKPDPAGVEIDLEEDGVAKEWLDEDGRSGFEIRLADLQNDLTSIRFYNSW